MSRASGFGFCVVPKSTSHESFVSLSPRMAFVAGVFLICGSVFAAEGQESHSELTREGKVRQRAHQFLFGEFIKGRKTVFRGAAESRALDEVVVNDEPIELRDGQILTLPEGAQRVAGMFRHFGFRGRGFERLKNIQVLPFAAGSHPHESKHEPNFFRVQMVALPLPTETVPQLKILFEIEGEHSIWVDQVFFSSQGKLSTKFDEIPYKNLGYDQPPTRVKVDLDVASELSVGGIVDLQRSKWFRYYAVPGGVHSSFELWANERNFSPGRQIFKFQPALVKGYSRTQPLLTESKERPGAADLTFFDRYDASPQSVRAIKEFQGVDYAMCLDQWPKFMSVQTNGRGTPLLEHFDDAAELAAEYVRDQIRDGGSTATWWEVKNESSIKSEWDYHYRKDLDPWGLLSDFHNRVADKIHEHSPETKVGGPSSAWMQLQSANFGLFRNQCRFIDETRGHIDFFSHHFYEDIGSLGAFERRGGNYRNYLLGSLESIFDMLRAHMHRADHVLPMLVTECGSLQEGRSPADNWLRMRSYSAYLTKMMQRPDQLDLVVPFVFLQKPWAPQSGNVAFVPKAGRGPSGPMSDFDEGVLARFFDLWSDFDGRRLPVHFDQRWLDVVALHRGARIDVAATNMGGQRLTLDLSNLIKRLESQGIAVKSMTQKRLRYFDGEVIYEELENAASPIESDSLDVSVDVEETTVLRLNLDQPLSTTKTLRQDRWYATEAGVDTSRGPSDFSIDVDSPEQVIEAQLVVGLYRANGFPQPLQIAFNGVEQSIPMDWADEFQQVFMPVSVSIPKSSLKGKNELRILSVPGLTVTSVHLKTMR